MLLTADIGNTNITLGVFNEEVLVFTARLATDTRLTSDQYAIDIKDVLYDMCNLFNCEQLMSAQTLGAGKEAGNLADYWTAKIEKDKQEFHNKSLVTALL